MPLRRRLGCAARRRRAAAGRARPRPDRPAGACPCRRGGARVHPDRRRRRAPPAAPALRRRGAVAVGRPGAERLQSLRQRRLHELRLPGRPAGPRVRLPSWPLTDPDPCGKGRTGRAGQEQALAPAGWTSLVVCADDGGPAGGRRPTGPRRSCPCWASSTTRPGTNACDGVPTSSARLVLTYPEGPPVELWWTPGCEPSLGNGSLSAAPTPAQTELLGRAARLSGRGAPGAGAPRRTLSARSPTGRGRRGRRPRRCSRSGGWCRSRRRRGRAGRASR